jgi:hypothetical protein
VARDVLEATAMPMLTLGIALVGVAVLVLIAALVVRGKGQKILSAPVRKTGDAAGAQGPVGFEGAVRASEPLRAPCSGQPCVYYEVQVDKKVKTKHGASTQVAWKTASKQHFGSTFWLDDGSGAVAVHAQDADADLQPSYSGALPPGFQQPQKLPHEEIVDTRVIEKIVPVSGRLFALGAMHGGQLVAGKGKLILSTRGRDALLHSTKRLFVGLSAFAATLAAAGALIAIVKPGEARPCGDLRDTQKACVVSTYVTTHDEMQADGSTKKQPIREQKLQWQVTKEGKYQLEAKRLPREKGWLSPVIQVEDKWGLPMNVGLNFKLGESSNDYTTKTKNLEPGTYTVYVWSNDKGPDQLLLGIAPAPQTEASK